MPKLNNTEFTVNRADDRAVYVAFENLFKETPYPWDSAEIHFDVTDEQVRGNREQVEKNKTLQSVLAAESDSVKVFKFSNGEVDIMWRRKKDQLFDGVTVAPKENFVDAGQFIRYVSLARKHLWAIDPARSVHQHLEAESKEFYASRQQLLADLQATLAKYQSDMTRFSVEATTKLMAEHERRQAEADQRQDKRAKDFEADVTRRNEQFETEKAAFAKEKADFDDRQTIHARRKYHDELIEAVTALSSSVDLSGSTTAKREPIKQAFGIATILFGILWISSGIELSCYLGLSFRVDLSKLVVYALRQLGLTTLFVGMILFYVYWLKTWSDQHTAEEFKLRQYKVDIKRASWLFEMSMQWQEVHKSQIPRVLLDRLSTNLFATQAAKDREDRHPMERLASAILSNIKLTTPAGEATLNAQKAAKELKRQS